MQVPKISLDERKTTFKEVEIGFNEEQALQEANRCLNCANPTCVEGCPAKVNIPGFIKAFKEGRILDAIEIIREKNFFPSICGRICQHERQCEGNCVLSKTKDGPVNIGGLERFIGDFATLPESKKLNGKKVAIIGSGPSGLTAAAYLALKGLNVCVFEVSNSFGGVIKYGVPEFRLPKKTVSRELTMLHGLGIDFEPNSKIAEESIEELSKKFDVVFIGTGVGSSKKLNIPGSNLKGIISAMKFLVNLNQNNVPMVSPNENVVIIGAGYVGIDAARSVIRLGAKATCVTISSREDAEKSVSSKDYLEAEEEGVKFL
ncbi:MAG: FAD-dependent oxidoreductase, partial [Candidatus ainarchaeum sp.]|nr:FAD-dependent oxidoreductase [Candidatus ainarchaeum sp.]